MGRLVSIDSDEVLVSHKEVARRLGITSKALYHMIYDGKFKGMPVLKNGRRRMFPLSAILKYIEKNLVTVD